MSEQTLVKTWERLAPMSKPSHLPPEFGARLNGAVQFTWNGDASEREGDEVAQRARTRWAPMAACNLAPAEVLQSSQQERIQETLLAYVYAWLLNTDEILRFYGSRGGPLCYVPSLSR